MYQPNILHREVLITPQEVMAKVPGSHTLDPAKYLHAIEIAEERFISKALGNSYYEKLITSKNITLTQDNIVAYQQLIDAEYVGNEPYPLKVGMIINASELLSANDLKLWNRHLWKLVAECVRFVAIPENFADFTSQGIMKNNPGIPSMDGKANESASVDLKEVKFLMDKWIQDRIDPLIESMHQWICLNRSLYPFYTRECDCDKEDGVSSSGKGGWITSLYDDEDNGRCGC